MLKFETKRYKASKLCDSAIVPAIGKAINVQNTSKALIEDYQGLFVGYGSRATCYPYREQNLYTETEECDVKVAILENDVLYAEFLLDYGARLWKLKNKITGEDLVYANDVIRLRNLSLRNAWFSGGVEWNIGIIGHTAYTCENLYCAKVKGDNGEEVLRFYEFERVREVYYQMDFWLDNDKLMVRVRIDNPNEKVVPMYWWSNIATPEFKGGRLIVDANSAFSNSDGIGISKTAIPIVNGVDVSYYENIMETIDYFFDVKDSSNKFIVNVNSEGKGLLQISSSKLKGRKLFSWGHTNGSRHWQEMLTDNAGDYVEIQAGLGKTQYECVPMPPKTSWEWVEVYTGISIDKPKVNGDYDALIDEVNRQVASTISTVLLDEVCDKTKSSIALKKGELLVQGKGFGHIKNMLEHNAPRHLDFSGCKESKTYYSLLTTGKYSDDIDLQVAFPQEQYQIDALVKEANSNTLNWNVYYQLAVYNTFNQEYTKATELCEKSMVYNNNYLNNHLYSFLLQSRRDNNSFYFAERAINMKHDNYSLAESLIKMFVDNKEYDKALKLYKKCDKNIAEKHRLKMYASLCNLRLGEVDEAEKMLLENGGLRLNDYREGDKFLNELYIGIRMTKYGEKRENIVVPLQFDFVVVNTPNIVEI